MRNTIYKHNARGFFDVYTPLTQSYPGKPTWLFEEMAGLFDFQSELMNRIATDILTPITRESAYAFADRFDYTPVEADGCTVEITFTLRKPLSKTLPIGYKVGGISKGTGELVIFELIDSGSNVTSTIIKALAKQKETKRSVQCGVITRQDDYMDFPIDGFSNIIRDSITLTINTLQWIRVDNFDTSKVIDRHFRLLYQSNGKARVQFSNGISGTMPPLNSVIYADFEVTRGVLGIMGAGEITINIDADPDIEKVMNLLPCVGGNNAESVESIKRNARANVRTRNIIWTVEDLEFFGKKASSSIAKCKGIGGMGTASLSVVPTNGGTITDSLMTHVREYLQARTQFGCMPVSISPAQYKPVHVTVRISVRKDFTPARVSEIIRFALVLMTSSFDSWVLEYYFDNGIDACRRSIINVCSHPSWGFNFVEEDNDALQFIIETWNNLLGDRESRQFGQPLEVGNIWIIGDNLYGYGVDEFDLLEPLVNVMVTPLEIIESGVITVK